MLYKQKFIVKVRIGKNSESEHLYFRDERNIRPIEKFDAGSPPSPPRPSHPPQWASPEGEKMPTYRKKWGLSLFGHYFTEEWDCPLLRKKNRVSADFMNNSGTRIIYVIQVNFF